eukprot:118970-Chlamydomonas_euryale.AAC.3
MPAAFCGGQAAGVCGSQAAAFCACQAAAFCAKAVRCLDCQGHNGAYRCVRGCGVLFAHPKCGGRGQRRSAIRCDVIDSTCLPLPHGPPGGIQSELPRS